MFENVTYCKYICILGRKINLSVLEVIKVLYFVLQLERFNAKMAEMDKKFKHELLLIEHQHSKLTV